MLMLMVMVMMVTVVVEETRSSVINVMNGW